MVLLKRWSPEDYKNKVSKIEGEKFLTEKEYLRGA